MPWLSVNERNQAIGMIVGGMSARVVARRFGCCRKTIDRLTVRYQHTGAVHDLQRPGRHRVTRSLHYVDALTSTSIGSHSHC